MTYGELAKELEDTNPEQIDKVFDAFEEMGVNLLSDDFEEEPDIEDLKEVEELKLDEITDTSFEGVSVDDPVRMYLREIGKIQLLSYEKELELAKRILENDEDAKQELAEANLRLVVSIAKKYYDIRGNVPFEDLIQAGNIGLIKAINTYNPDKKIKLSSYASRCIENEILMHFRNCKKNALDISLNEAIDTDKDGSALTLMDVMSVEDDILDTIDTNMNLEKLYKYMEEVLNEREKEILTLRFGLYGNNILTQREIAEKLKISRSYVSRIEKKALHLLKRRYEKN